MNESAKSKAGTAPSGCEIDHGSDQALSRRLQASAIIARGREVIRVESEALALLEAALDDRFVAACEAIFATRRQLVVTGMGKSGHIGRKVAATFAATGTPAMFIHPAEAAHGDLGMLVTGDVLLVLSNSGNTSELRAILNFSRKSGIPIIGVASGKSSQVIELCDIPLILPKANEACAVNVAPTTSTAMQLALGDALAMTVMDMRGISIVDMRALHPGGSIGLQLTPVGEIMHGADRLPLVNAATKMAEAVSVMTIGCFGLVGVQDDRGNLIGIITDGDLRRHFDVLHTARADQVMTPSPKTIPPEMIAADVLQFLNDTEITATFVLDPPCRDCEARPIGIVHIHDLLRFGLN